MSKLWGGRFSKETNKLVEEFTKSIQFDYKLAKYDILGSMIHVEVLKDAQYLKQVEADALLKGLDAIYEDIVNDKFEWDKNCEDIHTDIQNKLAIKVGDLVQKLHTARSRNDQVVLATKWYVKDRILDVQKKLVELAKSLVDLSNRNLSLIIPGFTHMQHAQPVYLKDYLVAYVDMFFRDDTRLNYISENIRITMGAGALAGTPIDAETYSLKVQKFISKTGIDKTFQVQSTINSLDSVSDRDFVIEVIGALSIIAMHLSRLSEDFIIWSTKEFDFIKLDDAFCTGSSLMPQKKNPDVLELVRGYTGRLYGNLVNVLTVMKGLPLTYNRDMQLDKEPLFDSFEIISKELQVLKGLIETLKFNEDKIKKHLDDESLYATDLVYYLIDKGVPFKEAHTKVGELIRYVIQEDTEIKKLPEDVLKEKLSLNILKKDIVDLFDPKRSVDSKKSVNRPNYNDLIQSVVEKAVKEFNA